MNVEVGVNVGVGVAEAVKLATRAGNTATITKMKMRRVTGMKPPPCRRPGLWRGTHQNE